MKKSERLLELLQALRRRRHPVAGKVLASIANWLSAFSHETLRLEPDLDGIPALSAEREARWKRVTEADFLTATEKRALLGLPKLADD